MPYRALPLKPTAGQPWRDFGDATYDNVAQFLVDIPALKADVANVAAQAAGLSSRAPLNSPSFTGTVSGVTKAMVGLGNVDNTTDTAKTFSASQLTTGTVPAARLPAALAGIRTRTPANEANPTATNWQARPAGFAVVVNVGALPAPVDAVAGDLHVPLASIPTTAGTTFTAADGSAWPAPWTVAKMPTGGVQQILSNEGRLTTGAAIGSYSSTDAIAMRHSIQAANVDVTFTIRRITSDCSPSFVLRCDQANLDPQNGISIPMSGSNVKASQVVNWAYTDIATVAKAWTLATNFRVRVQATGTTIRVKQWPATGSEPATWDITGTTTVTASGYFGFSLSPGATAGAYTAAYDDITVTTS